MVKEGSTVNKKDVIARLDNEDYKDQYQLALVKLSDAQQQEKDSKEQQLNSLLDDELRLKTMESDLEKLRAEYQEMEQIAEAYAANEGSVVKIPFTQNYLHSLAFQDPYMEEAPIVIPKQDFYRVYPH